MNKSLMYVFISIGGLIGGYIPTLFGANGFSAWAILGSTLGGIVGIYAAVKLSN